MAAWAQSAAVPLCLQHAVATTNDFVGHQVPTVSAQPRDQDRRKTLTLAFVKEETRTRSPDESSWMIELSVFQTTEAEWPSLLAMPKPDGTEVAARRPDLSPE